MLPIKIFAQRGLKWSGAAVCGLVLAGAAVVGCEAIKAIGVQMAPTSEKVPPEFDRLAGKKVLIHVWAPPEIRWDYTHVQLDLASYVGGYLKKNVKDVDLVDPARVAQYLEQKRDEVDPADLGGEFKADMVVHLAVYKFSMRDVGMAHFYRGRIGSSVVVYDLTKPKEPDRVALRDVMVVVPPEESVGFPNIRTDQIRQMTYDAFAVEVGKKFHEWERPLE